MVVDPIDHRLSEIEQRLAALESLLGRQVQAAPAGRPPIVAVSSAVREGSPRTESRVRVGISASTILGWAGAAALLLAAAYFVRLAIVEGWLTPWIQVAIAAIAGIAMIGGAFALRPRDIRYSSLLGAGGIAVLYVAVYGAHVYHGLIGPWPAIVAASAVAAFSLVLHALFRQPVYVAFALVGTYLTPALLPRGSIQELAIYLGIWNVAYGAYAVWQKSRGLYLAAAYAFVLVFAWGWEREVHATVDAAIDARLLQLDFHAVPRWFAAAFLWFQACVFVVAAVLVSSRARQALTQPLAWAHLPALLFFYGLQNEILGGAYPGIGQTEHPDIAPLAGIALALAVYAGWAVGRAALEEVPRASLQVAHAFAAIVFVHAVYSELVPPGWRPLVAFVVAAAITFRPSMHRAREWPILAMGAFLFLIGYVGVAFPYTMPDDVAVVGRSALFLGYPTLLYVLYFESRGTGEQEQANVTWRWLLLGLAHTMSLAATGWLVEQWLGSPDTTLERLWLSCAWAAIGLAWLLYATASDDRTLARSTLGIFAAFGLKVVFSDLDSAEPLVRVGILVVLGLTLYAGGWIYRRVISPAGRVPS
ncbi:MAG TPA: DUF2339 domain-containing protein [Gemmatimonadota bacterium]|nr:DUF2339 domain-containing protein [Gemmatimonadota bacterium]